MKNEIIIFENQEVRLEVNMKDETVWLSLEQMAKLFGRDRTVITRHINNIFKEKELERTEVCAKFAHTTIHGAISGKLQVHDVSYYNLDVIISVGYRVKSLRGTRFRQWATGVLREHLLRGYSIRHHDRFLIIDDAVYLFGASLKDAGKKLFAYIKMQETSANELVNGIR